MVNVKDRDSGFSAFRAFWLSVAVFFEDFNAPSIAHCACPLSVTQLAIGNNLAAAPFEFVKLFDWFGLAASTALFLVHVARKTWKIGCVNLIVCLSLCLGFADVFTDDVEDVS